MNGKQIRLSRLFDNGNAVVVAIDHGEFDGPITGMEILPETARHIDQAVSAVLISPGMLTHCAPLFTGRSAPMAMVRLNWSTVYAFHWGYHEADTVPALSVHDAVAAGADCVLASLTLHTGSEARDAANVRVFCETAAEARRLGVPIVGECFPPNVDTLSPEELHDQIYRGVRILAELGADLIKTFYTVDFAAVTRSCPVPVLGLGAEKTPTQLQALQLAQRIVDAGGRGVVFGRNAIQVPDPKRFQSALIDVVRNGLDAQEAIGRHELVD